MLATRAIYIVPVLNPDGYEFNRVHSPKGLGMARKNRRPTPDGKSCRDDMTGVDLNRNFDYKFDFDNAGSQGAGGECEEDYRGTAAFSEPESQALQVFAKRHALNLSISWHSYGRVINVPFNHKSSGHAGDGTPAWPLFQQMAASLAATCGFKWGHAWDNNGLYTVNGATSDWLWAKHGVLSLTPELGPFFDYEPFAAGMWPPANILPGVLDEAAPLAGASAWLAGARLAVRVVDQQSRLLSTSKWAVKWTVQVTAVGGSAPQGPVILAARWANSRLATCGVTDTLAAKLELTDSPLHTGSRDGSDGEMRMPWLNTAKAITGPDQHTLRWDGMPAGAGSNGITISACVERQGSELLVRPGDCTASESATAAPLADSGETVDVPQARVTVAAALTAQAFAAAPLQLIVSDRLTCAAYAMQVRVSADELRTELSSDPMRMQSSCAPCAAARYELADRCDAARPGVTTTYIDRTPVQQREVPPTCWDGQLNSELPSTTPASSSAAPKPAASPSTPPAAATATVPEPASPQPDPRTTQLNQRLSNVASLHSGLLTFALIIVAMAGVTLWRARRRSQQYRRVL